MSSTSSGGALPSLDVLRGEIDRIDQAMHELLMERGRIIDHLIAIKTGQGGGSAFRPDREASMMRRLALRHRGLLPLDTAEGIWRIIIATFTYVQSNFNVHADTAGGDAPMRDTTRFHFGFTVPFVIHDSPLAVIEAVRRSGGDLGVLRINAGMAAGPWWKELEGDGAPKIIARLPFVERPDHPAGLPVFTISPPLAEAAARDRVIYSVDILRWRECIAAELKALDVEILCDAGTGLGLALAISAPGETPAGRIADAFRQTGAGEPRLREIGSHAARFELPVRDAIAAREGTQ